MKIINVDEARSFSGFDSLNGNFIAKKAFSSIEESAKKLETSTSVEFRKIQLRKYSIKEGREIIEDQGFEVKVSENKGIVKLHISWFLPADKNKKLVF